MKRPILLLPLFAFLLSVGVAQGEQPTKSESSKDPSPVEGEAIPDYIRFVDAEGGPDLLQTGVTRFQKGATVVDLVAVVHVGDKAYYEGLNQLLASYDVVLYEMVGGEHRPDSGGGAAPREGEPDEVASVRQLQQMAKTMLGLEFQLESIDYGSSNFVHADVDWDALRELNAAKNQSLTTLFSRASALSEQGSFPGVPSDEAGLQLMLGSLLTAITTGDSNGLKRTIAPMLSEAEELLTLLEGDDGTVLVTERNKVVMEKLAEVREKEGAGSYAIFYGAGHMPDLEARLREDGFEKIEEGWLDAWSIAEGPFAGTGAVPGEQPAPNPMELFFRMMQENPEMQNLMQQLGEALQEGAAPGEQ